MATVFGVDANWEKALKAGVPTLHHLNVGQEPHLSDFYVQVLMIFRMLNPSVSSGV